MGTLLAAALREHGTASPDAARLATLVVAAIEGSVAMCRAKREIRPLDDIATKLDAVIRSVVRP